MIKWLLIHFYFSRKPPAAHHYLADGSGRDWYVLANHGGMIERYRDTGDKN